MFPGPLLNALGTGTPMVCFQTDIKRVWVLCLLLRLPKVWTWWENCISGLCVPLSESSWFSLAQRPVKSTSMSHMSHPQLGSLILPFASSAKTSRVECGALVRCCSSHPLWKSTRSFTSTSANFYNFPAIHKSRNGCSQWLLPCFVLN